MVRKLYLILVECHTCKYLKNYLNGKHDRHTTQHFNLKEKNVMSNYFKYNQIMILIHQFLFILYTFTATPLVRT